MNKMRYNNKYGNKKIILVSDGKEITFDSVAEAHRYRELKLLEKAGKIKNLQMQVKYVLIPAQYEEAQIKSKGKQKRGKCIERECAYFADFVYMENGELIVEDVKGYRNPASPAYAKYTIKRKLMLYVYGIRIKEVR